MNFVEFWSIFGRFLALFGPFDAKTTHPKAGCRGTYTPAQSPE
jgi:hypothetical protein